MGDDAPVQHCTLDEPVDLERALAAAGIEHLDADEHRTIVIYQRAILIVIVTEGQTTAARAFDVQLWEPPADEATRNPADLLTAFIDELLATTETSHR